jgi:hypothetical protein
VGLEESLGGGQDRVPDHRLLAFAQPQTFVHATELTGEGKRLN